MGIQPPKPLSPWLTAVEQDQASQDFILQIREKRVFHASKGTPPWPNKIQARSYSRVINHPCTLRENTMIVEVQVTINGSREAIWAAITNIKDAAKIIRGIDEIEIVEQPTTGLVGLKWRETRQFFGKPSTVEKVITEAVENEFYKTRAEFDGCVYLSTNRLTQSDRGSTLTSIHESRPQGIVGKILLPLMGIFFKGMAKKALLQDLLDIQVEVEQKGRNPA